MSMLCKHCLLLQTTPHFVLRSPCEILTHGLTSMYDGLSPITDYRKLEKVSIKRQKAELVMFLVKTVEILGCKR